MSQSPETAPETIVPKRGMRFVHARSESFNPETKTWAPSIWRVTSVKKMWKGSPITWVYYAPDDCAHLPNNRAYHYIELEKFPTVVGEIL